MIAEDEAANATEESAVFIVDHTAPQIVLSGTDREGNIKKGSILKVGLLEDCDRLLSVVFNGRNIAVGSDNTAYIAVNDYGLYRLAVKAEDPAGNVTDTEIETSCYMAGAALADYMSEKGGVIKEMTMSSPQDIDYKGLAVGLISVLTGTFGLTYRTFLRH